MRISIIVCLLLMGCPCLFHGAEIEGDWTGSLDSGSIRLRLVLHVHRDSGGELTATLDSIDQGAPNIPVSRIEFRDNSLQFELSSIGASYQGTLASDGASMAGTFIQHGVTLPLTLQRGTLAAELRRPQDPRKPYPYDEAEVTYENQAAGIRLAATLTMPRYGGPHPAVLLITGSGPQDRNESLAGHRPFLVLADFLTRRGIAVLRADDRGFGRSTGKFTDATTQDFVADALAGVNYLRTRKEIDPGRIGLLGHSEGGLVAPMAVSKGNGIAFIVMLAGPGVTGEKILFEQQYLIAKAGGAPEEVAARLKRLNEALFEIIKSEPDNAAADKKARAAFAKQLTGLPPEQRKAMASLVEVLERQLPSATSPWFRGFLTYDPRAALSAVKVPVLAVAGELDLQVPPRQNLPAIVDALEAGRNPDYTVIKLPRLNHLFQTAETGSPGEYSKIDQTIAPAALEIIGDWIERHVKKR